ncbi:uncharacterized protein LOC119568798 [Penaeus monodon]|uniref:uncharacterized protein LOC119568798 n=1 Tax=Penaeus monodon TaxID=6687 RepID=UPI0018A7517E|nr:uncharacterized protein LOC119568798 [Penaeus monodon]
MNRGLEFDLVVAVTDGAADAAVDGLHENTEFNHYGSPGKYPDNRPHGYPLIARFPTNVYSKICPTLVTSKLRSSNMANISNINRKLYTYSPSLDVTNGILGYDFCFAINNGDMISVQEQIKKNVIKTFPFPDVSIGYKNVSEGKVNMNLHSGCVLFSSMYC